MGSAWQATAALTDAAGDAGRHNSPIIS